MYTVGLVPLYMGAFLSHAHRLVPSLFPEPIMHGEFENKYLYAYTTFAIVNYVYWSILVTNAFCTKLGIYCFKIGKRKTQ